VLDKHLTVACGADALRLTRVQLAGRPAMAAENFLRGHVVTAGVLLGA
jgi:methionyl-tRNA formyltransferase